MRDRGIIVGAIVCALCGLVILCVAAQKIQPSKLEIASITEPGTYVACEGIVCQARDAGKHCFVKLFDGSVIDVPFFNCTEKISAGDYLCVEGTVSVYNGELEIIPKKYEISKVLYGICSGSTLHTLKGIFHTTLNDGVHAVIGSVDDDHLEVERELPLYFFVEFHGRISQCKKGEHSTFQIFGNPCRFFSDHPIAMGEISGFGVQSGEDITVLYYQWDELPLNTIAEAKQKPEGYPVRVCGTIESVHISEGHVFLTVKDSTGCILVPVFRDQQSLLGVDTESFSRGQNITVTGVIKDYNGAPEIIPEVIT